MLWHALAGLSGAAVLEAVPRPWGSSQTLIKVLPGRGAARAELDELTGRWAGGSDKRALLVAPQAETGLGDRDDWMSLDGQGNSFDGGKMRWVACSKRTQRCRDKQPSVSNTNPPRRVFPSQGRLMDRLIGPASRCIHPSTRAMMPAMSCLRCPTAA
ncbi:hypothetical protein F5883DRAFT_569090 [Diaporthe sp. PMI_573]|nr:hypothetical protein F5883DRAFT_569090 [Diaporthaceae sp. PMI_573]